MLGFIAFGRKPGRHVPKGRAYVTTTNAQGRRVYVTTTDQNGRRVRLTTRIS